jgi:hypothetical protein
VLAGDPLSYQHDRCGAAEQTAAGGSRLPACIRSITHHSHSTSTPCCMSRMNKYARQAPGNRKNTHKIAHSIHAQCTPWTGLVKYNRLRVEHACMPYIGNYLRAPTTTTTSVHAPYGHIQHRSSRSTASTPHTSLNSDRPASLQLPLYTQL